MLMAMATPIFSRLYMLYRSKSLHGSKASVKSENAEKGSVDGRSGSGRSRGENEKGGFEVEMETVGRR